MQARRVNIGRAQARNHSGSAARSTQRRHQPAGAVASRQLPEGVHQRAVGGLGVTHRNNDVVAAQTVSLADIHHHKRLGLVGVKELLQGGRAVSFSRHRRADRLSVARVESHHRQGLLRAG